MLCKGDHLFSWINEFPQSCVLCMLTSCRAFDKELEIFHHYHYTLFCCCYDPFLDHLLVCFLLVKFFFVKIQVLIAFVHHANLFLMLVNLLLMLASALLLVMKHLLMNYN